MVKMIFDKSQRIIVLSTFIHLNNRVEFEIVLWYTGDLYGSGFAPLRQYRGTVLQTFFRAAIGGGSK